MATVPCTVPYSTITCTGRTVCMWEDRRLTPVDYSYLIFLTGRYSTSKEYTVRPILIDHHGGYVGLQEGVGLWAYHQVRRTTCSSGQDEWGKNVRTCTRRRRSVGRGGDQAQQKVTFKYPRSKVFVGGLDFKLTDEDLK